MAVLGVSNRKVSSRLWWAFERAIVEGRKDGAVWCRAAATVALVSFEGKERDGGAARADSPRSGSGRPTIGGGRRAVAFSLSTTPRSQQPLSAGISAPPSIVHPLTKSALRAPSSRNTRTENNQATTYTVSLERNPALETRAPNCQEA